MLEKLRLRLVSELIELNESFFFNRKLLLFYKKAFNNDLNVVLDVGANKGQSIELFLKLNKNCTIHAFEPNPALSDKLKAKYKGYQNIHIHKLGISDVTGLKTFHENIFEQTSTFEEINFDSKYLKTKAKVLGVDPKNIIKESYPVEVITLSDFLTEHNMGRIDLLKIDTEGHEYSCLKGLFKGNTNWHIRFIQMEIHNDDMCKNKNSSEDIFDLLDSKSYKTKDRIKHGFGDFSEYIFEKV